MGTPLQLVHDRLARSREFTLLVREPQLARPRQSDFQRD